MIDCLSEVGHLTVPRETFLILEEYVALLVAANKVQNLIAESTVDNIWERHIVDSAQLVPMARAGRWLDIGSGAGLPGVVVAIVTGEEVVLLEPRRLRVEFLQNVKQALGLSKLTIVQGKPSALKGQFENIAARAVAPASELFAMARHLSHNGTKWLLPKGRGAKKELAAVHASWQGAFRLEPSRTDPTASILIGSNIRPRGK